MMSVKIGTSVSLVIGSFTHFRGSLPYAGEMGAGGLVGDGSKDWLTHPQSPLNRHLTASSNIAGPQ